MSARVVRISDGAVFPMIDLTTDHRNFRSRDGRGKAGRLKGFVLLTSSTADPAEVAKRFRTLDGYGATLEELRAIDERDAMARKQKRKEAREKAAERRIAKKENRRLS